MASLNPAIDARLIDMSPQTGFADLYQRYSDTVYQTALRVTGSPADAEDIMQTVFVRILSQGNRLNPDLTPERYFRRAATNAAVDILRRKHSHPEDQLDESLPHAAHSSPELLKEQLRRAIARLEQSDAVMFLLRYVEGLSNGELGELFGIDKTNVAVRLHRIRQVLKAEMER